MEQRQFKTPTSLLSSFNHPQRETEDESQAERERHSDRHADDFT